MRMSSASLLMHKCQKGVSSKSETLISESVPSITSVDNFCIRVSVSNISYAELSCFEAISEGI